MTYLYIFLGYIGMSVLSAYVLWNHYIIVMGLMRVRDAKRLTPAIRVLGWPRVIYGLLIDFYVNVTVCTVILLEWPREGTVSTRLWRLSNAPPSWRQKVAYWVRTQMLDAFDPSPDGVHRG